MFLGDGLNSAAGWENVVLASLSKDLSFKQTQTIKSKEEEKNYSCTVPDIRELVPR